MDYKEKIEVAEKRIKELEPLIRHWRAVCSHLEKI